MKTLYYLKKAISLPPHIVAQKLLKKLKMIFEAKKNRWIDEKFSTFEKSSFQIGKQILNLVDPLSLPKQEILDLCNHYLGHQFDLLGSGLVKIFHGMKSKGIDGIVFPASSQRPVNQNNQTESLRIRALISKSYIPIDWHIDFKSGYRWNEDTWAQDIRYGSDLGADVKVPWELARMQHLTMLAWGYALTKDPKYVLEFQNQVLDFIASNPPRFGVNWVCTMDVGIRIANWLLAYDLFRAFGAEFDLQFVKIFSRSVHEHGKHIFTHLEWDPYLRSNHYLANIAGLLFVAIYLENPTWLQFSIRELEAEVLSQFHPDGSNFEASTSYHRLSAEMVVYATALALEIGIDFSEEYRMRIAKMADFIRDITKPDGTIVQFGDNDSGRFLKIFPEKNELDHRYLVRSTREMKSLTSGIQAQLQRKDEKALSFVSYPDFGLFIERKDPWFLAIRCGSIGQKGNGGHAHNDQLSFELCFQGISMIVDPGTYVYTPLPKARRKFRSTAMHNTLVALEKEQNEDLGLFQMKDRAHAKCIHWEKGQFIGEHSGFGAVHRRTLHLHKEFIEGIDECESPVSQIYFHLAPNWQATFIHDQKIVCSYESLKVDMIASQGSWKVEESEYSKGYGVKQKALLLILETSSQKTNWQIRGNHAGL